jgi:hypothetical protein
VRLDLIELRVGQLAGLQKDRVRNPDLANVVQRSSTLDQFDLRFGKAQSNRQQTAGATNPSGVLLRFVVPGLRRKREVHEDLELSLIKFTGPLAQLPLEDRVVLA